MSISYTYDGLKTALQAWLEDSFEDFTDQLDDIIAKAETRCQRDLALEPFDATDTAKSTAASTATLALADNAVMLRELWVNDAFVEPRSESYVYHYQTISSEGQPLFWCQSADDTILLAPVPDAIYSTRQRVLARLTGLSDSTTSTVLSTDFGDLLFGACKMLSEVFDKAPEDAAAAEAEYQALLASARPEVAMLMRKDY